MNTKRFDRDDPQLSAYALGELEGAEREEIEALLASDPEAERFVEELRAAAAELETGLKAENGAALEPQRREAILRRAADKKPARRWLASRGLAAAIVLLGTTVIAAYQWTQYRENAPFVYTLFGDSVPESRLDAAAPSRPVTDEISKLRQQGYQASGPTSARALPPELVAQLQASGYTSNATAAHFKSAANGSTAVYRFGEGANIRRELVDIDKEVDALDRDRGEIEKGGLNTEGYAAIEENPFRRTSDEALSTFSIDVDTASYANARRFLVGGQLPPLASIRVEEFINYFTYDYPDPTGEHPFSVTTEVAVCPWAPANRLVLVGIQGKKIANEARSPSNLVFLIDVSGSMDSPDKLPLLVRAMKLLVDQLGSKDQVAMVVYAGAAGLVLESTPGDRHGTIVAALDRLKAGGSTAGAAGLELAYQTAQASFIEGGVNRVILCTDGDFNVGVSDDGSLVTMIEEKRKSGVFLSVLGFGTGNLKDSKMEQLADKGNGSYAYIDSLNEARKVLVEQASGTLEAIAKDVKIQVEFNPAEVEGWRLVGYENRLLAHQDFNDDTKDAGEIGAGASVTALYELVPKGGQLPATIAPTVDESRYQTAREETATAFAGEALFLKLRYKRPDSDTSTLIAQPVAKGGADFRAASENLRFATSVAAFAQLLRGSKHLNGMTLDQVSAFAAEARGEDAGGYRAEFLHLVSHAMGLRSMFDELRQLGYVGGESAAPAEKKQK